jgi:hypothetical protein
MCQVGAYSRDAGSLELLVWIPRPALDRKVELNFNACLSHHHKSASLHAKTSFGWWFENQ